MATRYAQCNTLYLSGSGVIIGATTINLTSLKDIYGNILTMSDFGDKGFITLEADTENEEAASFTGVTANPSGTYTLTGVKTIIAKSPYTETSGLVRAHGGGSSCVVTDNIGFWNTFANKNNDETITGQWTFTTFPVTPAVSDASTTVKGISKLSVAPVSPTNPIAVGDNDTRIQYTPTSDEKAALAGSQGNPKSTNKYITQDNVYDLETDQTQTTQNSTVEFGMANTTGNKNIIDQSFIPLKTKIRGVKLYKSADTGTYTGDITIGLYADSAGNPTGSVLATSTITNSRWISLQTGEFEALFSAEYSMAVGSTYHIKISSSTSDSSNHPNIGTNTAGGYPNGSVKYYNVTDGYVAIANIDLYFKTLQGIKSQVVETNTSGGIDTSIINNTTLPMEYEQNLYTTPGVGGSFGSSNDGSVIYYLHEKYIGASTSIELHRALKDTNTGKYVVTHVVSVTSGSQFYTGNIVQIGSYIYLTHVSAGNIAVTRFLASDLTGQTSMTVPVLGATNGYKQLSWTDGVYLYIVTNSALTTSNKWSVSGTVFSAVSTDTCTSMFVNSTTCLVSSMYDGTNPYVVYVNDTSSAYPNEQFNIYKLNTPTGTSTSLTTKIIYSKTSYYINSSPWTLSSSRYGIGIANISSSKIYIINKYLDNQYYSSYPYLSNNAINFIPISKP